MKIISKIDAVKATFAKVMTVGLLAGAVVLAAPAKAQAQVVFGVHAGQPVYQQPAYGYYEPGYGYNGYNDRYYDHEAREREEARERYYAHERHEAEERQEAYARHEDHERREAYEHRGWNRREDDDR